MFQIGDIVVYSAQGVCQIVGIDTKNFDKEKKTYYVLKPKKDAGATFFVPTENEKALCKMRKIMSQQEVIALIDSMPDNAPIWIDNENDRRDFYKRILSSSDQASLIAMIHALYLHKKVREAEGKRLHISDERFMKDAEQLLYSEWQHVLNLDRDGLMDYIFRRIQRKC